MSSPMPACAPTSRSPTRPRRPALGPLSRRRTARARQGGGAWARAQPGPGRGPVAHRHRHGGPRQRRPDPSEADRHAARVHPRQGLQRSAGRGLDLARRREARTPARRRAQVQGVRQGPLPFSPGRVALVCGGLSLLALAAVLGYGLMRAQPKPPAARAGPGSRPRRRPCQLRRPRRLPSSLSPLRRRPRNLRRGRRAPPS